MKLKRFNQIDESAQDRKFEMKKHSVLDKIDELLEEYDGLTKMTSPKHWRVTGHHFVELRKMKKDIQELTEITEKEKENDWVKKQIEK